MTCIALFPPSFLVGDTHDTTDAQNNAFWISVSRGAKYRAAVYAQELWEFPRALLFGLCPWYDKEAAECFSHEIMAQAAGILYNIDVDAYRHENAFSVAGYDYVRKSPEGCEATMKSRSEEAKAWVLSHLNKIKKVL